MTELVLLLLSLVSSMELYYDYQCYDGSYVTNALYCPNENNGCPFFASYRCSTGACVNNYWDCPRVQCDSNKVVCNDGFCHDSEDNCSRINVFGCTGSLIRCVNGECSESCKNKKNECQSGYLCPSGQCVSGGLRDCLELPTELYARCNRLSHQYNIKGIIRLKPCIDGSCVHISSECPALNKDPVNNHFPCGDKVYRASTNDCPVACPERLIRCIDGRCSDNNCLTTITPVELKTRSSKCGASEMLCLDECITGDCNTLKGFPLFECADGSFASVSFAPLVEDGAIGCMPSIRCPMNYPYLCKDNSCAEDNTKCPVNTCSGYRCTNGECVRRESDCVFSDLMCPKDVPVLCFNGQCMRTIQECRIASTRLVNADKSCDSNSKVKCFDGSCMRNANDCLSIPKACDPTTAGYRCTDGTCASNIESCTKSSKRCYYDQILCIDQTCARSCLPINGCPIQRPFQCPNGACVYSYSECLGRSSCPVSRPYQCTSMECVKDPSVCEYSAWMIKPLNVMLTLHTKLPRIFDVCEEAKPEGCVVFYIPSGTQLCRGKECYNAMIIRPVADSVLRELWPTMDEDSDSYMRENIHVGYSDLDGMTIIKSPIVNITGPKGAFSFTNPIRLKLYINVKLTSEYCLGQANLPSKTWTCQQRVRGASNLFWISSTGIYAIIYYPQYSETKENINCPWPCTNPDYFVLSVIGSMLLIVALVIILWVVSGAKHKSKEAKKKVIAAHKKLEDFMLGHSVINVSTYEGKKQDSFIKYNEELYEDDPEVKEELSVEIKKEEKPDFEI